MKDYLPLSLGSDTSRRISDCRALLGEIEGMSRFIPNVGMYLTMYVRKEALLSSQIEGTQCTFDDILDPVNRRNASRDLSDVINYVKASDRAVELLKTMPLCMRMLREVHAILLSDVRGADKMPGEVRTSQNWVGPTGCTLADASYVPPNVDDMKAALSDLEVFLNDDTTTDPIIKAALAHYQFETVHPFLDGNGRMGRLLVTLSLMNDGVLSRPIIYPSYELKRRRSEYYDWLMRVRETGDFEGWVGFFCGCLLRSAEDARMTMDKLARLHEETVEVVTSRSRRSSTNVLRLLDVLEGHPIIDVKFVARELDLSLSGANLLVREFCSLGILEQPDANRRRYRTFAYERYLNILRQGSDPLPRV